MFAGNFVIALLLLALGDRTAPNFKISILNLTATGGLRPPVLSITSWIIVQNKDLYGSSSTSFNQLWMAYRNGFGQTPKPNFFRTIGWLKVFFRRLAG